MSFDYSGKRTLILGGSSRLGLILASKLLELDAIPVLTWRNSQSKKRIRKYFPENYQYLQTCQLDFDDCETLQNLEEITPWGIDFLVDFVHEHWEDLLGSASEEKIYEYFAAQISFRAAVLKRVSRAMLANRQGKMLYISSRAAVQQNPGQGFYAASKSASEALYRNIGLEMGKKGIRTVILQPGLISSGRGRRYLKKHYGDTHSFSSGEQVISPEQVADTILFLLSDAGDGFNATALRMDCGSSASK